MTTPTPEPKPFRPEPSRAELDAGSSLPSLPRASSFEGVREVQLERNDKLLVVDFAEAAAHAQEKPFIVPRWTEDRSYEVWHDDNLKIVFTKFGPDKVAHDPSIPPFSATLMTMPGKSFYMNFEGKSYSTLGDGSGHILREGESVYHFYGEYSDTHGDGKPLFTLRVNLDQVNDWSYPERPAVSEESRALRKSWNRFWLRPSEESSGGFVLEATPRKKLDFLSADDMRKLPGPGELIAIWERDDGAKLEDLYGHEDRFTFAYDPKSKSYAIAEYTSGESDHRLYIFDQKGGFVGYYRVQDDGSREWLEAYPGELGKSE